MALEEEVIPLMRFGGIVIMSASVLIVSVLMIRRRNYALGWVLAHLILFSWSAEGLLRLLEQRALTDSIKNSLGFAWIGIIWAASMFCLTMGLMLSASDYRDRDER